MEVIPTEGYQNLQLTRSKLANFNLECYKDLQEVLSGIPRELLY